MKKYWAQMLVVTCMIYMILFSTAGAERSVIDQINLRDLLGVWRTKDRSQDMIVSVAQKGILVTYNGEVAFGEYIVTAKDEIALKEDSHIKLYLVDPETIRFNNIDLYKTEIDGLLDKFYTGDYETMAQNPKSHKGEFIATTGKIARTEGVRNDNDGDLYRALFLQDGYLDSQYWITFANNPSTDLFAQDNVFILGQILGEHSSNGICMPHILVIVSYLLE